MAEPSVNFRQYVRDDRKGAYYEAQREHDLKHSRWHWANNVSVLTVSPRLLMQRRSGIRGGTLEAASFDGEATEKSLKQAHKPLKRRKST